MGYLHNGKKVIAGVMSVFMLATSVNMPAFQTVKADEIVQETTVENGSWEVVYSTDKNGTIINDYKWKIDEDGVLIFAPTGDDKVAVIGNNTAEWKTNENKAKVKTIDFQNVKITNGNSLFYGMNKLETVSFAGVDFTEATSFTNMFAGCGKLVSVDFTGSIFKTVNSEGVEEQKLTSVKYMFEDCTSLKNIDFTDFAAEKVTDLHWMYFDCPKLQKIDLSKFNIDNINNYSYAIYMTGVYEIVLPKTELTTVTNFMNYLFSLRKNGCWGVKLEDGTVQQFSDYQSIIDYQRNSGKTNTYVFCYNANTDVVKGSTEEEYTGKTRNDMNFVISVNGVPAVEGIDYDIQPDGINYSKKGATVKIVGKESGSIKAGTTKTVNVEFKKASVEIVAADGTYHYTGQEITDPEYTLSHNVVDENGNELEHPNGKVTFTYYTDKSCAEEFKMEGKPVEKGMYWCVISLAQSGNFAAATSEPIVIRIDVPIIKSTWQAWDYDGTVHKYTGFNFWNPVNPKKRIYTDDYEIKLYSDPEYTQEVTEIKDAGTYYPVVTFFAQGDYAEITLPLHFVGVRRAKPTLVAEDQEYVYSAQKVSYTNYTVTGVLDAEGNPVDEGPTGNIDIRYFSDPECTESVSVPKNVGTYYVRIFVRVKGNYQESDKIVRTMVVKPYTPEVVVKDTYYRWDGTPKNARNGRDYTVIHAKNGCMSNPNVEVEYYQSVDGVMVKLDGAPTEVDMYYYRVRFLGDEPNYTETDWSDYKEFEIRKAYPVIEAENTYVDYDGEQHDLVYTVSLGDEGQQKRVLYYVDPEFTQLTSEVDGASYAGGAPSEPGTYYTKVIVSASTHYNWVSDKSAVLTIIDDYDYEISEPWNFYSFKGYAGFNDPWEPVRDYTDEIDEEELGQIEELAGYNLSELKVVYHRFAMPVFVTDPEDLLKPIEVVDEFDFPKTESGAPRLVGYYNAEVLIADDNGEYRSLSDELHFTIGWTLSYIMY